jgi:hypothetical protein
MQEKRMRPAAPAGETGVRGRAAVGLVPSAATRSLGRGVPDTSLTSAASKTRRGTDRAAKRAAASASGERRFAAVRAVQAGRAYFVTAGTVRRTV